MLKRIFISAVSISLLALPAVASVSYAAGTYDYVPLAPLPNVVSDQGTVAPDVGSYILNMYMLFISLSGVLAVFMIVYGGLKYMTTDAFEGKKEGKDIIVHALWGLAIVIASYLILYTINPDLLNVGSLIKK